MKYYKGACEKDVPLYGGKFVEENGYGHEEFNFLPIEMEGEPESKMFDERLINNINNYSGENWINKYPEV